MKKLKIAIILLLTVMLVPGLYVYNYVYAPLGGIPEEKHSGERSLLDAFPPSGQTGQPGAANGTESESKSGSDQISDPGKGTNENPPELSTTRPHEMKPEQNITVIDIEKKYRSIFVVLRREYEGRLNNLAARAIGEYESYREAGRKPPVLQLVNKYIEAGSALEKECDSQFYTQVARLESDLRAAELPLELAERARRDYKNMKTERKKQLIRSGLEYVGQ